MDDPSAKTDAPARPAADAAARRARIAVSALFLTNGALFANILPRYPEIKTMLGLDNTTYGLSIAALPAGALLAGLAAAVLIRRLGSARVAVFGTALTSIGYLLAGLSPSALLFAGALFLTGVFDAITDVAQNAHGLRVQRRFGRSIINSFHAIWSIGAVLGGAMAAAAIAIGLPVGIHLAISTAVFAAVALCALRFCLPGLDEEEADAVAEAPGAGAAPRRGPSLRTILMLAALTLIAMAGAVGEDAGNSWATLYLADSLDAAAPIAPLGFIALMVAQTIGRLMGDRLTDRFGQRLVAGAGGLIAAAGMGLALAFPSILGTILGFAALGFGIATLIPAAMHAADELPGLRRGVGLTVLAWLLRVGFLLSPPFVGYIADQESLRAGLLVAPAAGIVAVVFCFALEKRRAARVDPHAEALDIPPSSR
ncbi:MFS transporter [Microbacterium sp. W4I20]|uniref:MFS transporter n=1 Tax=Microbacterium sp. W4I20 TaxID=3042262 RepID=UPI00278A385B|nr:MFS transporter [Microbacterium sp. W4I20]MDQ0727201.1 MFS family permease [Microbacterium sp. W4I20]